MFGLFVRKQRQQKAAQTMNTSDEIWCYLENKPHTEILLRQCAII